MREFHAPFDAIGINFTVFLTFERSARKVHTDCCSKLRRMYEESLLAGYVLIVGVMTVGVPLSRGQK